MSRLRHSPDSRDVGRKRTAVILMLLCVPTGREYIGAAEVAAGDAKITSGSSRGLWERATLKGVVYSDFTQPEKGKPLDLSKSKTKELAAKVKALNPDTSGPCTIAKGRSMLGDPPAGRSLWRRTETLTLGNGLLKVVIVPRYGGRIIEISNAVTGANIFIDNYQNAAQAPDWNVHPRTKRKSAPNLLGGWVESVDDGNQNYWNTPHQVRTLKATDDEVIVRTTGEVKNETWGVEGTVTVERTVAIRRGSGVVKLHVKLTNHSGKTEREMRFRSQARHALGTDASGDEFWVSGMGFVTRVPKDHVGDCYVSFDVDGGLDTWQGIIDRDQREGVVVLPGGEIAGRMDVFGSGKGKDHWYTCENDSMQREHVIEGDTIEIDHDYAPVLNFDAMTFATSKVAVEFVPEKVHFAPGETVKVMVGAAGLATDAAGKITLTPMFVRNGKTLGRSKPITADAALLVADPRLATFKVPGDLEAGPCTLQVEVAAGGKPLGVFRYRTFVAGKTGPFLTVFKPEDDGYGKGLSATGKRLPARVIVRKTGAGTASGAYEVAGASLPWTTDISPVGGAFKVTHTVDFSKLPRTMLLQTFGIRFPYRLGTDVSEVEVSRAHRLCHPYQKFLRVTVGGTEARDEQWLVDQARGTGDQEYHKPPVPYWALSDSADRLPVWRFGGVLQTDPTTAWVWKSSNYDSAPMPMIQHRTAAGWVDAYSLLTKRGVLVYLPGMVDTPPREVIFDGETGAFAVYFFPPHVPAMSLGKAGRRGRSRAETWGLRPDGKASFTFYVLLHDEDLTGHLPEHANLAGRVRRIVEAWRP